MLYISFEDFYNKVKEKSRFSREEEKQLFQKMNSGDENAKRALIDSYLFVLCSAVKRYSSKTPTLEMIYEGISILENAVSGFDFSQDNVPFARHLDMQIKKMIACYIADGKM